MSELQVSSSFSSNKRDHGHPRKRYLPGDGDRELTNVRDCRSETHGGVERLENYVAGSRGALAGLLSVVPLGQYTTQK
eukprot:5690255-Amphidinium_carterae.1